MAAKVHHHSVCETRLFLELFKLQTNVRRYEDNNRLSLKLQRTLKPDLAIVRNRDDDYLYIPVLLMLLVLKLRIL